MSWPTSSLFAVQETPTSGRGVFSTQLIPTGTQLLACPDLVYGIVFREYRREVCNWCFRYDQGDILPVRENRAALVWCTEECNEKWMQANGKAGVDAFAAVEDLARKQAKMVVKEDEEDRGHLSTGSAAPIPPLPTPDEIEAAWTLAETTADLIRCARYSTKPSKSQRKATAEALSHKLDSIVINHAISSLIASRSHPSAWQTVQDLYASPQPYNSATQLDAHLTTYLQLLALLPLDLLPFCTRSTLITAINRDAHNSFGIRSLDDDASEMFGYGTWPSASYWNHSCSPNVLKRRSGRTWTFTTTREVKEGEELCITYLGGDEDELGVTERREMLWKAWKFVCGCTRCKLESQELQTVDVDGEDVRMTLVE
jgi:hypothetical protein